MYQEPEGTKLALIKAAGELFAESGLDGPGIRTIAEKAGVNIAAINYHFGSKENLYAETFRYVISHEKDVHAVDFFKEVGEDIDPCEASALLYRYVKETFSFHFSKKQPRWFNMLVMRALQDPSPSLQSLVEEVFRPDMEAFVAFIQKANPSANTQDGYLLDFLVVGQIFFYSLCRVPILMALKKEDYDKAFIDKAADQTAKAVISVLGLPLPRE
ncbi:CerR family C-terminal domain-containing protein [bacterium]|nr:CerR family C-terminal domain-containing protein [bacterium]